MSSFWSRLGSWLRGSGGEATGPQPAKQAPISPAPPASRASPVKELAPPVPANAAAPRATRALTPKPAQAEPEIPREAPKDDWRVQAAEQEPKVDTRPKVRIGVDFGTSTTQVAYRIGQSEPRMLRLEAGTTYMPSYFAIDTQERHLFGSEAVNYAENVHSIKLLLVDDNPIDALGGMKPSEVAYRMIEEVVKRAIDALRSQRALPEDAALLEVATNFGCTPRFTLAQRLKLRDVAQLAGLNVRLADLVEEPVAAAFELVRSSAAPEGAILVVDVGGGTMDVAVVRADLGTQRVDLYATTGAELGGDQYTAAIENLVREAVEARTGAPVTARRDTTLIWRRAEAAKVALSAQQRTLIPLGGIAEIEADDLEVTRDWFEKATSRLVSQTKWRVENTYRLSRLMLDRGGPDDPAPGTIEFHEPRPGERLRITQVGLADDGVAHLAGVVLVGGAGQLPALQRTFKGIFGVKFLDPRDLDVDPVDAVVLGLARGETITAANLRFPNWGVTAIFATDHGETEVPLYEPFSPAFEVRAGYTSVYRVDASVPNAAHSVALAFRPVAQDTGTRWEFRPIHPGAGPLRFSLTLFGVVSFTSASGADLLPTDRIVPWATREAGRLATWFPPNQRKTEWWKDLPYDWRDDR